MKREFTSIELCAGAGGQALGVEAAGFEHVALVEIDQHCCNTLKANRKHWKGRVHAIDLKSFDATLFKGVDLLAAGLPCPPFSKAGKQLGADDERNLFPEALKIIKQCKPRAVMIENVRGILDAAFDEFRQDFKKSLEEQGYISDFRLLNASDFGVPQLRPRVVFVALKREIWSQFKWPTGDKNPLTVGEVLLPLMSANGWTGAKAWAARANSIAPTIVGGSKKHGGPDLGPTRAKKAWERLQVNAHTLAEDAPNKEHEGMPRLTIPMVGLIQGFPESWIFSGKKTQAYRQVGNAFPPPVAKAVAREIHRALKAHGRAKAR